jgi:hypothetical protein
MISILLTEIVNKEKSYKYCEEEINVVNDKEIQTKKAKEKLLTF